MNLTLYIYIFFMPFIHSFLIMSHKNHVKFSRNEINDYKDYQLFLNKNQTKLKNDSINNIYEYNNFLKPIK